MTGIEARDLVRLQQAQRRLSRELLGGPLQALGRGQRLTRRESNVVAVEIGERLQKGQPTYEWCVRVVVRRKFQRMPIHVGDRLPRGVNGLAVDVIQGGGPALSSACLSNPCLPYTTPPGLLGGLSIGPRRSNSSDGTAGLVVQRQADPHYYVLTNRHVVHTPGAVAPPPGGVEGRVQQPGRGSSGRVIGRFGEELLMPLQTGGVVPNLADAALVRLEPAVTAQVGVLNCLGSVTAVMLDPQALRDEVDRRSPVTLSGSRSRGSAGALFGFDSTLKVEYPSGLYALFSDQVSIRTIALDPTQTGAFAVKGDSGSLVVMPTGAGGLVAVALLHSVSPNLAYAAPLGPIWEHFKIRGWEVL